jgi:hypothetical protein
MNYKIFQICFEPRQLDLVESPFTPFDNTTNEKPELREYHCFNKAVETGITKDLDAWGFFGPRWQVKLKYSAHDISQSIENNLNNDVWIFNHARVVNSLTYNVWEQGEYFHKGLSEVEKTALKIAGYNISSLNAFMSEQNTCYCSYFVARKKFWLDYIEFLKNILNSLDKLPEDVKLIYESEANYSRDNTLNMFPFLIERLFSTFLIIRQKKYRVYHKPYDYTVYKNEIGDFYKVLQTLNDMKLYINENNSSAVFDYWNNIRMHFIKNSPHLLNLD